MKIILVQSSCPLITRTSGGFHLKVTRPSFFGGYHPTLKLSGIPAFTFIVSLTHRMGNISINLQYNIKVLAIGVNVTLL